jgi:hypothetical protein
MGCLNLVTLQGGWDAKNPFEVHHNDLPVIFTPHS